MTKTLIIYGTTGGNTELVCQAVEDIFTAAGQEIQLLRAEKASAQDIAATDMLILASPTYGHGELEPHAESFLQRIADIDLHNKKCSVISLGDPKYDLDYHLESAKTLSRFIEEHNGQMLCPPLLVSKNPVPMIPSVVTIWTQKLLTQLAA